MQRLMKDSLCLPEVNDHSHRIMWGSDNRTQQLQGVEERHLTQITLSGNEAGAEPSISVHSGCHKNHHQPLLTQQTSIFSQLFEAESQRSGCQQRWFLVGALFLAFRWLPSHCILVRKQGRRESSLGSPLIRTLILWDQGPTLNISIKSLSPDTVTPGVSTQESESTQLSP